MAPTALCAAGLHRLVNKNRRLVPAADGSFTIGCRPCYLSARRRKRHGNSLAPDATKGQIIAAKKRAWWQRHRDAGIDPLASARATMAARRTAIAADRKWCRAGLHRWVPENLVDRRGRPTCRWCQKASDRSRRETERARAAAAERRVRLWADRLASHPDKGGTVEAFIKADAAWKRFIIGHDQVGQDCEG